MSDRQVSVRLGKGFWSRGPGPMAYLRAEDFPQLRWTSPGSEDYSEIFQANLELTLILSNAHDMLYSTKGKGWKLMLEGEYVKYIVSCSSRRAPTVTYTIRTIFGAV